MGGFLLPVLYEEQLPVGIAVRRAAYPWIQSAVMAAGGAWEAAQIVLLAFLYRVADKDRGAAGRTIV